MVTLLVPTAATVPSALNAAGPALLPGASATDTSVATMLAAPLPLPLPNRKPCTVT